MLVRYELSKRDVELVDPAMASGGEAEIFADPDDAGLLIKRYFDPTPARADKLLALVAHPIAEPTSLDQYRRFAWPEERVVDPATGRVVGFAMPRLVRGRSLHLIYDPRSPHYATEPRRLEIAADLARAVAEIHAHGPNRLVIGDLNDMNVLCDGRRVSILDIDSFQVATPAGLVHRCDVGVDEYTPPRLHGVDFKAVDRDQSDDLFGLAVLVWKLMYGFHPYADTSGRDLAFKIREGLWPHGLRALAAPPRASGRLADQPKILRELFARAFDGGHADPGLRPGGEEWARGLELAMRNRGTVAARARRTRASLTTTCGMARNRVHRTVRVIGPLSAATRGLAATLAHVPPWGRVAIVLALALPLLGYAVGVARRDVGVGPTTTAQAPMKLPKSDGAPTPAGWRRLTGSDKTPGNNIDPASDAARVAPSAWGRLRPAPDPVVTASASAGRAADDLPSHPAGPSTWQDHLRHSFELLRNEVLPP